MYENLYQSFAKFELEMAQGGLEAAIACAKARAASDSKRNVSREASAVEVAIANYYLQERYNSSESSSNRDELESLMKTLDYEVIEYVEEKTEDVWQVVDRRSFEARKDDISSLFDRAISNHYKAVEDDEMDIKIYANCLFLFEKDYKCQILENPGGALSWNYPVRMIIPVASAEEDLYTSSNVFKSEDEFEEYCDMSKQASVARCRNRFPVPVINCEGKYICRSGTLAVRKVVAFATMTQAEEPQSREIAENPFSHFWDNMKSIAEKGKRSISRVRNAIKMLLATSMDDIKDLDVKVLRLLNVNTICDLMVQDRKVHTGLRVGSSEKINLLKYGSFCTLKIPYPGCHFFKQYSDAGRKGKGLLYDWERPDVTSSFGMATEEKIPFSDIRWDTYMSWDLIELTKNYMKLLLHFTTCTEYESLLVHCISGWDRTPLFISLLRIALWADDYIHKSLKPLEMAYLTLAYDWYLFGHALPTRLRKREEIMHFCFNFLAELIPEEYSMRQMTKTYRRREHQIVRSKKLLEVRNILLKFYEQKVKMD